jgi:hypothetical protein
MSKQILSRVSPRSLRTTNFTLLIAAFLIVGLTASAWAWIKSNPKAASLNATAKNGGSAVGAPQANSEKREMEAVRLTIRPSGFEPSEITLPAKPFLLIIDNKSGLDDINLQVKRIKAGHRDKIRETRVSLKQLRKAEITDLPSGQYELTEANHPDWVCRVTIN